MDFGFSEDSVAGSSAQSGDLGPTSMIVRVQPDGSARAVNGKVIHAQRSGGVPKSISALRTVLGGTTSRHNSRSTRSASGDRGASGAERLSLDGDARPPSAAAASERKARGGKRPSGSAHVADAVASVPSAASEARTLHSTESGSTMAARKSRQSRLSALSSSGLTTGEGFMALTDACALHVQVGASSKAGSEPAPPGQADDAREVAKENQDAYCVHAPFAGRADHLLAAVFDGHGAVGRPISHCVRDAVPSLLEGDLPGPASAAGAAGASPPTAADHGRRAAALADAFEEAEAMLYDEERGIDHVFSGTTAVVAWLAGAQDLYCAWAGDSRCILGRRLPPAIPGGKDRFAAIDCTYDHKPGRGDEKKRIKGAGGRVARWRKNIGPERVWLPRDWLPGLAMTRSVGDTVLSEYGVEPRPDVTYTRLQVNDSFLVLASDGVWEFLPSQEVADFVGRLRREGVAPKEAADALVRESVRRWRRNEVVVDDTTAVVVYLNAAGGGRTPPRRAPPRHRGSGGRRGLTTTSTCRPRGRRSPSSSARARRRRGRGRSWSTRGASSSPFTQNMRMSTRGKGRATGGGEGGGVRVVEVGSWRRAATAGRGRGGGVRAGVTHRLT
ncbi:hypothetical protein BU14_0164s0009 [Porphyra umbilicalis]|uniref:PPM-type phosphatase domain-containing protein n=1 Tax=Porphyra umbilicalis TaxID=2786 RepID=A0A1X6P865_PORUM|nr:hypothetical protein BU14_0164s0009 [Porphyra umbilicalis]|eukprot:OSX77048.1 hypothetical protein BU14_0164s0009 [Porphyra umbilicalis]